MKHARLALVALLALSPALRADDAPPASQPTPADFREMKKAFPDSLAGLKRVKLEGSKMAFGPTAISNAKAEYGGEDGKLSINIEAVSYGNADMVKGMSAAWSQMEIDNETDDGFQKTQLIQGHHGMVEYNSKSKHASLTIGVADKILMTVTLENATTDDLKKVSDALPIEALAAVK